MPTGPYIHVEGARELQRAMRQAAGPGINKAFGAANRFVGSRVVARARPIAPHLDGDLRDSMRASATAREVIVRAGSRRRVPYAPIIHWGSRYRPDTPAQPFIAVAVARHERQIEQDYLHAVEAVVRSVSAD